MQGYLMINKDINVKFVKQVDYLDYRNNGWSRRLLFKSHLLQTIKELQKLEFKIVTIGFRDETFTKLFKMILDEKDWQECDRQQLIFDFLDTHDFNKIQLMKNGTKVTVIDTGFVEIQSDNKIIENQALQVINTVAILI